MELPDYIKLPKVSLDLVYLKGHLTRVDREFIKRYLMEKNTNSLYSFLDVGKLDNTVSIL